MTIAGGPAQPALLPPRAFQVQRDLREIFQSFSYFRIEKTTTNPQQISEHRRILSRQRWCWGDGCTQAAPTWLPQKQPLQLLPHSWGGSSPRPPSPARARTPESRDGQRGTPAPLLPALPAPAVPCPVELPIPAPLCPSGTGNWGRWGVRGAGERGEAEAARPTAVAGASRSPDARRGSRLPQEQFRRCLNVSQNTGNKRNFNGV